MLDLYEIVDISEEGACIQCPSPLDLDRQVDLCLDLAECPEHIFTSGKVIWSSQSGRVGLHFSELAPGSLFHLREWLFLNAMAGVANADERASAGAVAQQGPPQPSYSDTLAAVTAIQREVEALGSDLAAALQLIASRAQSLVRASGAAIALSGDDADFMDCRASSGSDAPPVGARLHVGSGFSGECVRTRRLLRCDDSEVDPRVDRESCRDLGIRSILAVPVHVADKSIGLLEAFSPQPSAFAEKDSRVMQRLADTVLAAVNRASHAESLPVSSADASKSDFAPSPGSVLFASASELETKLKQSDDADSSGISLPRSHLVLLMCFAATIAAALGYLTAPMIQAKLPSRHARLQTVLASTEAPSTEAISVATASLPQLQQMAENGDPAAQNSLGLRYAMGDGVKLDEQEAIRWFTKAADQGNVPSQSKLGAMYFRGRDIPQDLSKAYFWIILARASGDETSKTLAPLVSAKLTRAQAASIRLSADQWLQQHLNGKPFASR